MAQHPPEKDDIDPWLPEINEDSYGLSADQIFAVRDALEAGDETQVRALVADLHEADLADLVESLGRDDRTALINVLGVDFDPEVLPFLDSSVREDLLEDIAPTDLARSISELDSDDAVEVIEELDEEAQRQVLDALTPADRLVLEESLTYPEDSAGRLMHCC